MSPPIATFVAAPAQPKAKPSRRPWVLLADAPEQADRRRFQRPVRWAVEVTSPEWSTPFHVHVQAKTAEKALRAAKRQRPTCTPIRAKCEAPKRTHAGARLGELPEMVDHVVGLEGARWIVTAYGPEDGAGVAERIDGDGPRRGATFPAYLARELVHVGDAVRAALAASDHVAVIGRVATVLFHGVVLSAPAQRPDAEVKHATVGAHPDGKGGFACVTDPGGWPRDVRQWAGRGLDGPVYEIDRGPFAAAFAFVEVVGAPGALRAIDKAREKAGA